MSLPAALYDTAAVHALDALAIEGHGIPGIELMRRAGERAWQVARARWPRARRIRVYCGQGNNAGDGYVVARCAQAAGCSVTVIQIGDPGHLRGDARACFDALHGAGIELVADGGDDAPDLIVDALLGTGLEREPRGGYVQAITAINGQICPVLSLDVPSGVNAATGRCPGAAVRAGVTVTFVGLKQGLLTGAARDCVGEIVFDDLGIPPSVYEHVPATAERLYLGAQEGVLGRRRRAAHKGDHGHVLVVGGAPGYAGAPRMAGEAAGRVGAGLVSVAAHPDTAAGISAARPEIMAHAVSGSAALAMLVERASVIAIGPGLGTSDWASDLFGRVRATRRPLVVDADALNLLSLDPESRPDWVLTPHPGEAARLLGTSVPDVEADRFAAARELCARYGGTVVLKGAGTIVVTAAVLPGVVSGGNPGMATGGMGDVLTGIIAGLIAQGLAPPVAARLGCCIHAEAGDRAAAAGERGMLASDLMPHVRAAVN